MGGNKIQLRVRGKKGKGRFYLMETVFSFIYNVFPTYYIKRIKSMWNVGKRARNCILNNLIGTAARKFVTVDS